jgi:hypothetical protein
MLMLSLGPTQIVSGTVTILEVPVFRAQVTIWVADAKHPRKFVRYTMQDGTYEFDNIVDGEYTYQVIITGIQTNAYTNEWSGSFTVNGQNVALNFNAGL